MRNIYTFLFIAAVIFTSCKPEKNPVPVVEPPVKYVTKIATAESDYREYFYNSEKQLIKYDLQFVNGGGVSKTTTTYSYVDGTINTAGSEAASVFYETEGKRVVKVRSFRPMGGEISVITFSYNAKGQLSEAIERINQNDPGLPVETKQTYEYYSDGNLKRILYHLRYNLADLFTLSGYVVFDQYDAAKNPDKFFSSLVYLPDVIFQKNNPRRIVHYSPTGDVNQQITFEYTYDADGYPVTKRMFDSRSTVSILFKYSY
ncbi:YD repeat-containing protein [Lacibacter cauensis]|uniref:YD repeat-containing protein n=1 Tax=Lacibacter cauensis TaxID=510947 RepID=A0A562SAT6_9BACT|nr:hypothetical protein [Lacibacter cauensis]TWI78389.1 YD repeat-containing protein [Lacibacter cauensis]